jgi:curved DNA-binding protein CbpA
MANMDFDKDYYAILGVHSSAEEFVIKAAYRAMSQRYHPDSYLGSKEEAHQKMVLINEAYSVLSDKNFRKEYDKARGADTQSADSFYTQNDENGGSEIFNNEDWNIAVEYFPDLKSIIERLGKISWKVALNYQYFILERKDFVKRAAYAAEFEDGFLATYFGKNKEILSFAKHLIFSGDKKAALDLNKAVKVLGPNVDAKIIINKICNKYKTKYTNDNNSYGSEKISHVTIFCHPRNLYLTINDIEVRDSIISAGALKKKNNKLVAHDDDKIVCVKYFDYDGTLDINFTIDV